MDTGNGVGNMQRMGNVAEIRLLAIRGLLRKLLSSSSPSCSSVAPLEPCQGSPNTGVDGDFPRGAD